MSEFDFLEPIPKANVSVKLPSRGVLYPPEHPATDGKLTLTPMTMVDESLLMSDISMDQIIDKLLRKCVVEKFDINTLIGSDKFFLFMSLRSITYGPEYSFSWVCTGVHKGNPCGFTNELQIEIPKGFKAKFLSDTDKEPFVVNLPDSGREISFRLLRGYDEPAIEAHTREVKAKESDDTFIVDTTFIFRLTKHIVAVDGNAVKDAPMDKLMAFLSSLSARDRQYLQRKIAFYTPGLDTSLKAVCAQCGSKQEMEMPYNVNFFRTDYDEDEGKSTPDEVRPDVSSGAVE